MALMQFAMLARCGKMKEAPIKAFASPVAWRAWLEKNHTKPAGIWIIFYKKTSGKKSISYAQALDEALCFGWIDGQSKGIDEASWKQRFTPRRTKSIWSKRNRENVARLIKKKRMTPAGLKEIAAAKKDGRWETAYDSPKTMDVPADFLRELRRDPGAYAFYKTLNRANIYAIGWRLQTAKKPETRTRRMEALLSMLKAGKKFH